jgi:sortase B
MQKEKGRTINEMVRAWNFAARLSSAADHLLNAVIALMLIGAMLLGGFGVWDTWKIYRNAGVSAEVLEYKPTATGADDPNPILAGLQDINPDVCGWITVDNTNIDYPIVRGETNWTYLNLAVDKSFSLTGSIFLDYRNLKNFGDSYSLIYGHHMDGNVMFGELPYFLESAYFRSHTTGTLFTPEHTYYIQWFASVETDAYDNNIYTPIAYADRELMPRLLSYLQETATQYQDIGVSSSDRLIALSTCSNSTTDGRIVLIGRLSCQE